MNNNPEYMDEGRGKPSPDNGRPAGRRSIRLKGYDYSQAGLYFITICCQDRKCQFGEIVNDEMVLNDFGKIANDEWVKLSKRFTNFELDVFQIMPNHMHGIIGITATLTPAQNADVQNGHPQGDAPTAAETAATISDMVGAYKSLVATECLKLFKLNSVGLNPVPTMGKLWQRNYYEHIIRNEKSYQTISDYIINNPAKWNGDKFYMQ